MLGTWFEIGAHLRAYERVPMSKVVRIVGSLCVAVSLFVNLHPAASAAGAFELTGLEQQLVSAINTDRTQLGLSPLTVDPRLTEIARQRSQYIVDQGVAVDFSKFSHCVNGGDTCSSDQLHFGILLAQAGFPQMNAGENLAINNQSVGTAASATNDQWLASVHHRPQIVNPMYNVTGMGVVCCISVKMPNGQTANNVRLVTQIFAQYSPEMLASLSGAAAPASVGACQYILGFQSLNDLDVADTGACSDNQAFASNGDAQQHTSAGLMAWRKADNWTAFTNGYWTWINGPNGLAKRLNTERFTWEANPDGLPLAS